MSKRVIIVGAGIGGATLAIALIKQGFNVKLFEQAAALQELGAGLTLPGSAMKIYDALGLWDKVRDICVRVGGIPHYHYKTGEFLSGVPDHDWTKKPNVTSQSGQTHRALLHGLLIETIMSLDPEALVTGHRLRRVEQGADGVTAIFENGQVARGDLLVGCDGIRSTTYQLMFGESRLKFTGVIALRFLVRADLVREHLSKGRAANFIGPMRGLLRYGVRGGEVINAVALTKTDDWQGEGWSSPSSREELLHLFEDWHPDVVGLIEAAPPDGFYKWALFDRDPLTTWSSGRITLLGDAAHPMLPYLGQGATQAIGDAMMLSRALAAFENVDEALQCYETHRVEQVSKIVLESRSRSELLNQVDPYKYSGMNIKSVTDAGYDAVTMPL